MKKRKQTMRREDDFAKGVRGEYVGSAIVLLDPDVARAFPDAESVNRALRAIMEIAPVRARRKK
ncbi:MAG TPA: hypothetical protein VGR66_01205 [Candidatus Eisenbacteria bacterium]|jgi:hypothetical protein|nr:hypothetical protein [Candidatus Eisenbacteria bacterium]